MTIQTQADCPPQWLSVSAVSSGPRLVVAVVGEADWNTADRLRDQLTQALAYGPRSVILDLADLEFCNLRGLRVLMDFCAVARKASVDVTIRGMSRQLSWLCHNVEGLSAGGHGLSGLSRRPLLQAVPPCRPAPRGRGRVAHRADRSRR